MTPYNEFTFEGLEAIPANKYKKDQIPLIAPYSPMYFISIDKHFILLKGHGLWNITNGTQIAYPTTHGVFFTNYARMFNVNDLIKPYRIEEYAGIWSLLTKGTNRRIFRDNNYEYDMVPLTNARLEQIKTTTSSIDNYISMLNLQEELTSVSTMLCEGCRSLTKTHLLWHMIRSELGKNLFHKLTGFSSEDNATIDFTDAKERLRDFLSLMLLETVAQPYVSRDSEDYYYNHRLRSLDEPLGMTDDPGH